MFAVIENTWSKHRDRRERCSDPMLRALTDADLEETQSSHAEKVRAQAGDESSRSFEGEVEKPCRTRKEYND